MDGKEHIRHSSEADEDWICMCGNRSHSDGFYPCDIDGNEVEPTPADWKTDWYVCLRCGRLIDQNTLEVVGRTQKVKLLDWPGTERQ
jgi:hypothetical protein